MTEGTSPPPRPAWWRRSPSPDFPCPAVAKQRTLSPPQRVFNAGSSGCFTTKDLAVPIVKCSQHQILTLMQLHTSHTSLSSVTTLLPNSELGSHASIWKKRSTSGNCTFTATFANFAFGAVGVQDFWSSASSNSSVYR